MIKFGIFFIILFTVNSFRANAATDFDNIVDLKIHIDVNNVKNSPKFQNPTLQKYKDPNEGKKWKEDMSKQNVDNKAILFTRSGIIEIENINLLDQNPRSNHKKFVNEMRSVATSAALSYKNNSK